MWYLPIAYMLKRLYQSKKTAGAMRWHAKHVQKDEEDGEIYHPSDARVWKYFNAIHPDLTRNSQNVYLGLCTYRFSPFRISGRQYSLWHIILTPYNLPLELCLESAFLFMSILIMVSNISSVRWMYFFNHWYKSWRTCGQLRWTHMIVQWKPTLRSMILWTISDFSVYRIHERLYFPYFLVRHMRSAEAW